MLAQQGALGAGRRVKINKESSNAAGLSGWFVSSASGKPNGGPRKRRVGSFHQRRVTMAAGGGGAGGGAGGGIIRCRLASLFPPPPVSLDNESAAPL